MTVSAGQRVLVVGLGVSGNAAARSLIELGAIVRVTEATTSPVIEARARALRALGAEVETGGHDIERATGDIAVVSPGIAPDAPIIRSLRAAGVGVIGEIELAWQRASCDFLAVTGTNGKTTTTSLLAAMLAESEVASLAAGNIGLPLIEAVGRVPRGGAIAVEVSSFQLETIESFRPRVAVVLNVAEDHTDWHGSFQAYVDAKRRVVANQQAADACVVNLDDEHALSVVSDARSRLVPFSATGAPADGIGVRGTSIAWRGSELMAVEDVALRGVAGLEDSLAAAAAALEYGVGEDAVVRAMRRFRPLPHRLQTVLEAGGVSYIDDSKATNPHATLSAVRGLHDVVLIAGGRAKGIDLSPLASSVPPVIAVIAVGESADVILKVFDGLVPVERASSMRDAVLRARSHAVRGGSVLLAPGCASLDMYESYAARGEDFARALREEVGGSIEGRQR
ncbi:UDP-N-acetylmuramoyl-L-alanine--D-glutamate ligase [soil metagenome]